MWSSKRFEFFHSMIIVFINNYPFKNIVTISKTDVTMSYLSFVLHTLFSFQGAIQVETWFQYSIFEYRNQSSTGNK